jgi:transcriptional regulator with GAF, ATPase, and Fis domain
MGHEHGAGDDQVIGRVDEVTAALERLSDVLTEAEELEVMLDRVCRQVVHAIPDAHMSSILLLRGGEPHTAAATGEDADRIDQAQYEAGQGPCIEAAKTGTLVRVAVPDVAERWPEFAAAAGDAAMASYLSAPLFIDSEYHGSLNLYSEGGHGFNALDAALLELYTTAAEAALRTARRYMKAREHTEQLRTALTSRAVIDQAKGIIMAAHRISAEAAFAKLVRQSQEQNVKLRDLAERFVTELVNRAD